MPNFMCQYDLRTRAFNLWGVSSSRVYGRLIELLREYGWQRINLSVWVLIGVDFFYARNSLLDIAATVEEEFFGEADVVFRSLFMQQFLYPVAIRGHYFFF